MNKAIDSQNVMIMLDDILFLVNDYYESPYRILPIAIRINKEHKTFSDYLFPVK